MLQSYNITGTNALHNTVCPCSLSGSCSKDMPLCQSLQDNEVPMAIIYGYK